MTHGRPRFSLPLSVTSLYLVYTRAELTVLGNNANNQSENVRSLLTLTSLLNIRCL